jgi:very-short-patch-repair endonuclease
MPDRRRIPPITTARARLLRSNMTDVERRLWGAMRGKQLEGCRFRRQHAIGAYIVDFACVERMLVIELDGGQHQDQKTYDDTRSKYLNQQGWQVVRFWNNEVLENLGGVLEVIVEKLKSTPPSQPSP